MNMSTSTLSLQRISQHFINLEVAGTVYEMIQILIKNEKGEPVIRLKEELNSGKNLIPIDLSSLIKGSYSIILSDIRGQIRLIENVKL